MSRPAQSAELAAAQQLYANGQFPQAEAAAKKLSDGDKYSIAGLQLRARLELADNALSAAQGDLLQARRLDLHNRTTLELLGEAFWRVDKFGDAAPFLEQADRIAQARQAQALAAAESYRVEGLGVEDRIKLLRIDPVPAVAVRLDGGAVQYFAVDPGGSEVIVDTSVAEALDLPDMGMGVEPLAGERTRAGHSVLPSLAIGLWVVHDVPIAIQSTAAYGADIRGVIGAQLLAHFVSTIDFRHGELRLQRRAGMRGAETDEARRKRLTAAGATALPLHFVGDHFMLVDGMAGGAAGGTAATSADKPTMPLWFSTGFVAAGASPQPIEIEQLAATGLPSASAQTLPPGSANDSGVKIGGAVGQAFFRNLSVTVDLGNMLLWVER